MDPKRIDLWREKPTSEWTIGRLEFGATQLGPTLEPGYGDRDYPRVPAGFYHCTPHGWAPATTLRFKRTWALNGWDVARQPEAGVPRSAVVFHGGVHDEHSQGCILRGTSIRRDGPRPLLAGQEAAMDQMRALVGEREFYLLIHE